MLKQPVLSTEMVILLKVDIYPSLNKKFRLLNKSSCHVQVISILVSECCHFALTMLGFKSVSIGFVAHLHIVRVEYEVTGLWGDALNLPYKKYCC